MKSFQLREIAEEMQQTGELRWRELLRTDALSMGVYHLKAGDNDPQTPHTEDEVYYVVEGIATFRVGGWERPAKSGAIFFVNRLEDHRFANIEQDLTVLVFFAPAEKTLA